MSETVQTEKPQNTNGVTRDGDTVIVDTYQHGQNSDKLASEAPQAEQPTQEQAKVEVQEEQPKVEQQKVEQQELTANQLPAELQRFQDSYAKNGKLTEADYADLQKMGLPKAVVDDHIKMRQRLAEMETKSVTERVANEEAKLLQTVGGKEEYAKVSAWAATKLSEAERTAFNSIVNGKDFAAKQIALDGLLARYKSAQPKEPRLINGSRASDGVQGYESKAEWLRDIADAKYKKDPVFRANVEKRLARSNIS